jgi:hypothetical protein
MLEHLALEAIVIERMRRASGNVRSIAVVMAGMARRGEVMLGGGFGYPR